MLWNFRLKLGTWRKLAPNNAIYLCILLLSVGMVLIVSVYSKTYLFLLYIFRLSSEALNNGFFSRACQEYKDKLLDGMYFY